MPTLNELRALEGEAGKMELRATAAKQMQERMAAIRTGETPLMVAYKGLGHWQNEIQSLIEGVINEFGTDLLRIVEMRQEAFARKCKTEAQAKRAHLQAFVDAEATT